jgi:CubicO group peptidase (beta-lactamase class C family)
MRVVLHGSALLRICAPVTLMMFAACGAQTPTQLGGRATDAAIDAFLAPYVEGANFSGSILVVSGDDVLVDAGYGAADVEHGVANTPRTRFQIASISKTFTTAAVLLLRQRGELRLEDPISSFIPDFPNGDAITVHHLLGHTSGLPRYVFQPDYRERIRNHHSAMDLVEWVSELDPAAAPGQRFGYSNANYSVLAAIIERVSGQEYGEFLETEILGPLGLEDTGHASSSLEIVPNLASGYDPVGRSDLVNAYDLDYTALTGAGSLYSTTHDLLRWYHSLRHGNYLNDESKSLMFGSEDGDPGYHWQPTELDGRRAVTAQGWDGAGFAAKLIHLVDHDLTVIVLTNLNISGMPSEVAANLAAIALGEDRDTLELMTRPADPSATRRLAGLYRFGDDFYVPNSTIEFAETDGELSVTGLQPGALLRISASEFIHRQHWVRVRFEYGDDGRVTSITYGEFKAVREPGE